MCVLGVGVTATTGKQPEVNLPQPQGINPLRRYEVKEPTDYTEESVQQRAQAPMEGKPYIIHVPKTYSIKHKPPKDKDSQVQLGPLPGLNWLYFSTNYKESLPMLYLFILCP